MDYKDTFLSFCDQLWVKPIIRDKCADLLARLEEYHLYSAQHSLNVAIKASEFANYCCLSPTEAFVAGAMHDIGKLELDLKILDLKDVRPNEKEREEIKKHPEAGYRILIAAGLPFQALASRTHHWHQNDPYPTFTKIPKEYSSGSHLDIELYSPIIAIADHLDALRRKNQRWESIVGRIPREILIEELPRLKYMITQLCPGDPQLEEKIAA